MPTDSNTNVVKSQNGETRDITPRREPQQNVPSIYREMNDWMNQWDNWFNNVFSRAFDLSPSRSLAPQWPVRFGFPGGSFTPAVNVSESENAYQVTAELPGMDEKDIEISVSRGTLVIKGEKKQENEDKGRGYYRMERSYGSFQRTIALPEDVDADNIDAGFSKGLLTVNIPKLPQKKNETKKIEIRGEQK